MNTIRRKAGMPSLISTFITTLILALVFLVALSAAILTPGIAFADGAMADTAASDTTTASAAPDPSVSQKTASQVQYVPSDETSSVENTHVTDENGVAIDKGGTWTDDRGAEVTIAVTGTENIKTVAEPSDILFVVDASASMMRNDINPDHVRYFSSEGTTAQADIWAGSGYVTQKPSEIIDAAVAQGVLDVSGGLIPPDTLIKIPKEAYGSEIDPGADLWMYPTTTDVDELNSMLTWSVVDFNATEGNAYLADWRKYDIEPGAMFEVTRDDQGNIISRKHLFSVLNDLEEQYGIPQGTIIQSNEIYPNMETSNYYAWDGVELHHSMPASRMAYEAISRLSKQILKDSPLSNIAVAPFSTAAGNGTWDAPAGISFTHDDDAVDDQLYTIFHDCDGNTNYEAGWLYAKQFMDEWMQGEGGMNGNQKLIIFVSDGFPNRVCVNGDMTTSADPENDGDNLTNAVAIKDAIVDEYPDTEIATLSFAVPRSTSVEDSIFYPFSEGNHLYLEDFLTTTGNAYEDVIENIYEKEIEHTRILDVTDYIGENFIIDRAMLADGKSAFMPDYANYDITTETIDGQVYEKIVIRFDITDPTSTQEHVAIPLILKDTAIPDQNSEVATNFDREDALGASADYLDLSGERAGITTATPMLVVKTAKNSVPEGPTPNTPVGPADPNEPKEPVGPNESSNYLPPTKTSLAQPEAGPTHDEAIPKTSDSLPVAALLFVLLGIGAGVAVIEGKRRAR